jgi:type IV pilus assembly protein PilQ
MNIKQNNKLSQVLRNLISVRMQAGLFLLSLQISMAWAENLTIKSLDFSTIAGEKVQLQLEMDGTAVEPKVFQTDNPARIALDFEGVKSGLDKKSFSVNKGAATSVYVVEVGGRTRVVVNLVQAVPYQTSVSGNKILLTLNESSPTPVENKQAVKVEAVPESELETTIEKISPEKAKRQSVVARLLPKQSVKDIDFKRGAAGNGLLLVALAKPNTVVDVKEKGGKVVLKFLNTNLPESFRKRFDVSDFATPVQKVDAVSVGSDTVLTVSTVDGNYEYSSYQANGLLTVDFKPLTPEEKEAAAKKKFPYSGNKLSLNFQDIPVRDVLQVLADFTEFNMITTDAVGGNITLRLNDVPWDQALDLILKSKGLGQRKAGNVVWIAPMAEITKLEKEEEESQKVSVRLEPLKTEYIQINYAKAEDIKAMLMGQGTSSTGSTGTTSGTANPNSLDDGITGRLLSSRGVASVDPRTNTLIVKDTVGRLDEIRGLIKLLDIPVRQVMIESRIVIASKNFARDLGVKFGVAKGAGTGGGTFVMGPSGALSGIPAGKYTPYDAKNPAAGGSYASGGTYVPKVTSTDNAGAYLLDLGAAAVGKYPPAALAMTLARGADYVLNLELSALQNENKGEIVANPRVMTSDRVAATISQGVQIPYVTQGQGGASSTTWQDATLMLKVTPQITPNGSVIMDLNISRNNPSADGTGSIEKREVKTTVQIDDGETIVLGGVYEFETGKDVYKIPFFGDLPGVGFLFKKNQESERKSELLVFVTPKIVKDALTIH